jgi:hypothetical protein
MVILSILRPNGILFYGHLVHFVVIWYILWSFGTFGGHLVHFVVIWYIFPPFGTLYWEKSGNLAFVPQGYVCKVFGIRVTRWVCKKIARNVCSLTHFLSKLMRSLYRRKRYIAQKSGLLWQFSKHCSKANNRPMGKNSPNQVTLFGIYIHLHCNDVIFMTYLTRIGIVDWNLFVEIKCEKLPHEKSHHAHLPAKIKYKQ